MAVRSTGRAHWEGTLFEGRGTATLESGAAGPMAVDWNSRAEEQGENTTTPEELIAAAHAACFSMAFSNALAKNDTPATTLDVTATATFVAGEGITSMELTVNGMVEGIDEDEFEKLAEDAKENCPVSKALAGNVPISVAATLG
jgi:osmotically inducible protein OsmC